MNKAAFVLFRDSPSLQVARDKGVHAPVMEFGPDGAFATDLQNDAKAQTFMDSHGLGAGKFLCLIPRQGHTPYWKLPKKQAR